MEFTIIFPTLLLLILGVVQVALMFVAKATLNQAAYFGVREGTLNNASRLSMHLGIANGLAPLYQGAVVNGGQNVASLALARSEALLDVTNPLVLQLEILNPTPASFLDFGEFINDELGIPHFGIPNSRLLYDNRAIGVASLQTIQDANLLKIRVHYCYPLIVPFIRQVIQELFDSLLDAGGAFNAQCYASGGTPIEADATMLMQTPAYQL